ncbi:hypothetical protein ABZ370_35275 [Streptomyces sp. NPDC005962]|uniref:hypothetical protein n=1 Tax=Streptomyces sp. NPDC005962 TaxID=3154466 RepID=UPI0034108021
MAVADRAHDYHVAGLVRAPAEGQTASANDVLQDSSEHGRQGGALPSRGLSQPGAIQRFDYGPAHQELTARHGPFCVGRIGLPQVGKANRADSAELEEHRMHAIEALEDMLQQN